jgi:predicted permease
MEREKALIGLKNNLRTVAFAVLGISVLGVLMRWEYTSALMPFGLILLAVSFAIRGETTGSSFICTRCGVVQDPATAVKGSMLIELVLWLMFIVPGLIYSLWRLSSKHTKCRACGATELIPMNSPAGQKLLRDFEK